MVSRGTGSLSAVVLVLSALVVGCSTGVAPSRVPAPTSSSVPPATATAPRSTPTPRPSTTTVRAYFYLGGEPGTAGLVPVLREVADGDPIPGAVSALLSGPTTAEAGLRTITSAIPTGSRMLGLEVADGIATVDLSREFETGGGSASMFIRLGQVVFTLTQFPSVQSVLFKIDGQQVTVFSSEGIVLDHPQRRADAEGVLPAIFVDIPAYDAALGNPGRISGTADVFEAQFRVTILDAAGNEIADVPAMASCGTGCRGSFDVTVPYAVDRAQTGTLRVWDASMKDGSPVDTREYPVELVPAGCGQC
jgi:germination protein M